MTIHVQFDACDPRQVDELELVEVDVVGDGRQEPDPAPSKLKGGS